MTKFAIIGLKGRSPAGWVARIRQHRMDVKQERHGLEAMLHWQDPVERPRGRSAPAARPYPRRRQSGLGLTGASVALNADGRI
jgi:hypothetical protein